MSQPVKLSDDLVLDARVIGEVAQRSIAGQIEFWARLGRAVEPLMSGAAALALRRSGDARPLSALIESVHCDEGRQRVTHYLSKQPFPHYEAADKQPGCVVRIEAGGSRTVGRFVNRVFVPVEKPPARRKSGSKAQK
ncbi:hypothetical protein Pla175_27090 [Pirellulimonas nuda]|uniref:ParD-like antitoxin of type II toxin-antitoxin system n=1 Tax=Pirellulimonas nuda TaxID=2528009 RepID=A0A518DCY2_9BACT|nr:hypothetical protein [Pirellulimonas nuda]QDU89320.1 hypothetical protein Pla175_27090 [Pirellulimonas nuda]